MPVFAHVSDDRPAPAADPPSVARVRVACDTINAAVGYRAADPEFRVGGYTGRMVVNHRGALELAALTATAAAEATGDVR